MPFGVFDLRRLNERHVEGLSAEKEFDVKAVYGRGQRDVCWPRSFYDERQERLDLHEI